MVNKVFFPQTFLNPLDRPVTVRFIIIYIDDIRKKKGGFLMNNEAAYSRPVTLKASLDLQFQQLL